MTTTASNPIARTTGTAILVVALALALAAMWPQGATTAHEAPIVVIATPALPTIQLPTAPPAPTEAPAAAPTLAPPTMPPLPTQEPPAPQIVVEKQIIIQQVTVPPPPTEPPAPPTATPLPAGTLIILPTQAPSNQEFIDSFAAPSPNATCAFVGCLPKP